jgi:DNA-binding beta-propeller fold protein YncE
MEGMKSRIRAAAVLAGVVLFSAGCAADAPAPAGGHASPTAASPALPSPFTITARYTARSLGLDHPDGLAIGPDGNLYVADDSQRVTVISPTGKVLRRWGKPGSRPGQFRFISADPTIPTDVHAWTAVGPDGKVYVSDSGNGRVQVFTPAGRFIRQFGSYGAGKGQFLLPWEVVVDKAGNVYVADDQAGPLTKFSPAGKVLWRIGGYTDADPDLTGLLLVTGTDAHGRLVTVNAQNRVLYVDPAGHEVDAFSPSTSGSPTGDVCHAMVDAAGNTYVTGCGPSPTGPTRVYDRAHRLIAIWPGTKYSLLFPPVFGPDGEVFALAADGSILKLHITLPGG